MNIAISVASQDPCCRTKLNRETLDHSTGGVAILIRGKEVSDEANAVIFVELWIFH
jgi:hypothetical protein